MIEYVFMNGNEEELWEIDYEKKFALDVSELNVVKDKVAKYPGTIENYLRKVLKKCIFTIVEHFLLMRIMEVNEVVHLDNCCYSFL